MGEVKHSSIGGSNCERFWNCPGSVRLVKTIPKQDASFAAAEGTVAHGIAETVLLSLKQGKRTDMNKFIGTTLMEDDHEIEVTEEMVDAVEIFVKAIEMDLARFGTDITGLEVEKRFSLAVDKNAFGTVDAVLHTPFDTLRVYDFKYGKGVLVEVKDNKQLFYYSVGALVGKDVDEVEHIIVQPRAYHPEGSVRRVKYPVKEIHSFERGLKVAISKTKKKDAPLISGKWCKFCKAIGICDIVKRETLEVAKQDFADVEKLPDPILLKLLDMQDRIIDFLKEVKTNLQGKAERGTEVPGWKLVKARSNRKWTSESRVIEALSQTKYAPKLMAPAKLKTPAQLDKVFGKERDALLPFIDKPDKGLSLVRDADPRASVDMSTAEEDFENV